MHSPIEVMPRDSDDQRRPTGCFVILITIVATIGGFLFGYDTGIVSGAMIFITELYSLNALWQELIVSITIFAAWIFALFAGFLADGLGRKPVIIVSSLIFIAGSAILAAANSRIYLLVGRFVVGAGIGLASMIVPIYNAEVSPKALRGRLVAIYQNLICFGQFVAAIVAGLFSYDHENGWRYMLGLAAVPALVQFVAFFLMPETPRYLVISGNEEKALQVLNRTQPGNPNVDKELEDIKNSYVRESTELTSYVNICFRIAKTSNVRKALFLGCSLQMFQQIVGINTVMYYTATIIQISGVGDKSTAVWLSALVAFVNFVCNFISFYSIDKFGRRKTFLCSLFGVVVSLLILGGGFQLIDDNVPAINWVDDSTSADSCSQLEKNTCESCLRSIGCGFCYEFEANKVNAICLPVNNVTKSSTKFWNCFNGTEDVVHWTTSTCPTFTNSTYSFVVVGALMSYLFFFSFGTAPVPWIVNTEIYPMWARSVCISIATSVNWLFNLAVSMTFLTLTEMISKAGTFYFYAALGILGFILFFKTLPETKDISLEETELLFRPSTSAKSPNDNSFQTASRL